METLRDQHRMELDGCQEELRSLKTQHKCHVEAVEKENEKLCNDIMQVNNLHTTVLRPVQYYFIIRLFILVKSAGKTDDRGDGGEESRV